jgi:hypothetical protein
MRYYAYGAVKVGEFACNGRNRPDSSIISTPEYRDSAENGIGFRKDFLEYIVAIFNLRRTQS